MVNKLIECCVRNGLVKESALHRRTFKGKYGTGVRFMQKRKRFVPAFLSKTSKSVLSENPRRFNSLSLHNSFAPITHRLLYFTRFVFYRDVAGGDYAWNLLNDKEFYINSTSLIAVLEFFINKNDLENVINTLLKMHENGFEHLNRHVLKAILKLSTAKSIDPLVLLQYLQPNDEFEKAIADAIPAFVKCSKAELMPHIFEAIPLNRESNTKYLFIEMVCRSRPADEFMNVWNSLEKHGFDIKTHLAAYKPALNGQLYALIQEILKHMQSDPTEKLYDSAFKRLLELAAENSGDHLMEAIKLMCSTYKIRPRSQFIDSTIIPLLMKQSNFSDALVKLRYIDNIPVNYIGEACIKAALSENDIHKAYDIASSNSGALQNTDIIQGLQKAYLTTHDTDEFVRFLRLIFDNIIGRNLNSKRIQLGGSHDKDDKLIENIIQSTIVAQKVDSEQNITLLNALSREGFTISDKCNKSIVRVLKVEGKSDIGKLLTELMASNRTLRPISSALAQYVQEKNTAAIDNLLADNNIHICTAEYALLIDYYCWQQNLERILNLLESAREADHHFKLDFMKALQIINLMIKEKRIDSNLIRALLEENTIVVHYERFDMLYAVLSKLSIDGNDELVKCITHFAVKNNCVQRTNKLFGPTVAVHLRKNDFKGAVNAFERVAKEFGMAPMTIILYKTLIQNNENDLLDNAHHIYLNLYGEKAALIQLALAYAESGQHEKANEIFRHKSMPNVRTMISKYCFTFSKFNQVNALEGLLHSTKGLDCNRHDIYAGLLDIYCTQTLVDKVVSLKQLSIEEGVTLSPTCTKKMSHFLQSNGAES